MSFKNFLTESDYSAQEIAQIVDRDCADYMEQVKYNTNLIPRLHRGITNPSDSTFFSVRRRQDRDDENMPDFLSQFVNVWFVQNFHYPFRTASAFATGDKRAASRYGQVYSIFPVRRFRYLWSDRYDDLYKAIRQNCQRKGIWQSLMQKQRIDRQDEQPILQVLQDGQFKTTELDKAIRSNHDIMIATDQFYAVDVQLAKGPMMRELKQVWKEQKEYRNEV